MQPATLRCSVQPACRAHSLQALPNSRALRARAPRLCARPLKPRPARGPLATLAAQKQAFRSFDDMIQNSPLPVLVDFNATWCGPCYQMSKILATLAPAVKDKVMVVKVDTEKYPAVAARYSIHALPTLMLFKDGQPVDRVEGVLSAPDIQLRLMKFL